MKTVVRLYLSQLGIARKLLKKDTMQELAEDEVGDRFIHIDKKSFVK